MKSADFELDSITFASPEDSLNISESYSQSFDSLTLMARSQRAMRNDLDSPKKKLIIPYNDSCSSNGSRESICCKTTDPDSLTKEAIQEDENSLSSLKIPESIYRSSPTDSLSQSQNLFGSQTNPNVGQSLMRMATERMKRKFLGWT